MRFQLDTKSGVPIYRQIIEQVKYAISRGELESGDRLPTVRQLAVDLSVNPNTVVRAYRELEIAGILDTQQGSGTFVGKERPKIDTLEQQRMLDQILTDLLARASSYGFTLEDILDGLSQRKGALVGLTAFGQTAAGTAGQASEPPSPEPDSDTQD